MALDFLITVITIVNVIARFTIGFENNLLICLDKFNRRHKLNHAHVGVLEDVHQIQATAGHGDDDHALGEVDVGHAGSEFFVGGADGLVSRIFDETRKRWKGKNGLWDWGFGCCWVGSRT